MSPTFPKQRTGAFAIRAGLLPKTAICCFLERNSLAQRNDRAAILRAQARSRSPVSRATGNSTAGSLIGDPAAFAPLPACEALLRSGRGRDPRNASAHRRSDVASARALLRASSYIARLASGRLANSDRATLKSRVSTIRASPSRSLAVVAAARSTRSLFCWRA